MIRNLIGEKFGTLRIVSLAGRGEKHEPLWLAECTQCGTRGIQIPHRKLQQGNAVCPSSICGRPSERPTGTAAARVTGTELTGSARLSAERVAFDREQRQPRVVIAPDPEEIRRDAIKQAERRQQERQWSEEQQRLASEHSRYVHHAVTVWDLPFSDLCSLETWSKLANRGRERIMSRIKQEINERENTART